MHTPEHPDPDPETERLRATMHELVAMSKLAALWDGLSAKAVVDSLASVLATTLDLDLAYARLGSVGGESVESIRCTPQDAEAHFLQGAREALGAPATRAAAAMPHPGDGRLLRTIVIRFGIGMDSGGIVAGSLRPDFPTEHERLLLGVAANQATVVLQRHFAARALGHSEARFQDLADSAPAMLWVTEADGACSFLSRGWYAFTGQTRENGLGFGWIDAIHPDDREAAQQAFVRANEVHQEFSLEHRVLHVDGSYRWVIDAGRPRFSNSGEFLGFAGNVLDISERKATEQELHRTQDMLSAVFAALPVGVAVVDKAGKVLLSNQEMHQYLPTSVLPALDDARRHRWRAFNADGSIRAREAFSGARALRGERVVPGIEALYTKDDGTELWTRVAAVPLEDSDGAPSGAVTVVMDIDAFKRTEAALRRAESEQRVLSDELAKSNKNLSEFLAVLAHELRNPLAPLLTGLEIMRMRADSAETITSVRGIMERQVKQLSHLINDLLDIARVTNGKVDIQKQPVDLRSIVSNAVETSLPLIDKGRHAFSLQLPDAALPLSADAARIAQVIGNLLTNAAKYTPPGGRITLAVRQEGRDALISVSDNGIGIPPDSLQSVFEMFSQVGRNMQHAQGGLGIGLSLVRQLVSLHGGTVAATSEGVGRGSTFVVRLPLDLEPALAVPVHEAGQEAGKQAAAARTLRILVTDDNVDAAGTLAALLEIRGHAVRVAHDGQEALRVAAQFRPDVVFLDIGMPGLDGYEVARRLRQTGQLERSTIVAVSGWGAEDDVRQSREAGFDMHFTKPVAPAAVTDFLDALR